MVKDRINYRARGPNTALTRQPVQGRANDGGLRIGEMERDGVLGHGMSAFLNESFLTRGDEYYLAICNNTGCVAVFNESRNLFLSPFADGPVQFVSTPDGSLNLKNVTKFGRSFSIIKIPYSLKLLMQELQTMNVQMRIITDENVNQMLSLSYSDNVNKLLNNNGDLNSLLSLYTAELNKALNNVKYEKPEPLNFESEPLNFEPEPEPEPLNFESDDDIRISPPYPPSPSTDDDIRISPPYPPSPSTDDDIRISPPYPPSPSTDDNIPRTPLESPPPSIDDDIPRTPLDSPPPSTDDDIPRTPLDSPPPSTDDELMPFALAKKPSILDVDVKDVNVKDVNEKKDDVKIIKMT
jgi:hypothetical protein